MAKKSRSTIGEDPLDALVPHDASAADTEDMGKDAEEQPTPESPEPDEAETREAAAAASGAKSAKAKGGTEKRPPSGSPEEQPATTETARDLERTNKELHVRIRELELELTGGTREDESEVMEDVGVSQETGSIIAMVKDLHGEIDAAYELREALEADLSAANDKLAEERSYRAELDARMRLLEAKAALGDQLREDISFVEEERNETARRLEEVTSKLEQITKEREDAAEEQAANEARVKELRNDKVALEAKVLNLEEAVEEMGMLREKLAKAKEESQRLEESVRDAKGKLEVSDVAKSALDLDVTTTRELIRNQNEQIEELKDTLTAADDQLAKRQAKLDKQELEILNLQETLKRAEREIKTLSARNETIKKELDAGKKALHDIRAAAVRTTGHVRERHS